MHISVLTDEKIPENDHDVINHAEEEEEEEDDREVDRRRQRQVDSEEDSDEERVEDHEGTYMCKN